MVDLIMFALLVPGNFAFWLFRQLIHVLVSILLHRIFDSLGESQPVLIYPLIKTPIDCDGQRRVDKCKLQKSPSPITQEIL